MTDLIEGLKAFLLADPGVSSLTTNVFDEEIPVNRDKDMPFKCVIIRAGGGSNTFGKTLPIGDSRVNFLSYAETPHLAATLDGAVYNALKNLTPSIWAHTYIHWCKQLVGPIGLRDTSLQWPYVVSSWQALASDITV